MHQRGPLLMIQKEWIHYLQTEGVILLYLFTQGSQRSEEWQRGGGGVMILTGLKDFPGVFRVVF